MNYEVYLRSLRLDLDLDPPFFFLLLVTHTNNKLSALYCGIFS
jgi:hypothetical protein